MSNRSLLEFNHDYCPDSAKGAFHLGACLQRYMRAADPAELPPGVVRKHYRHHSDPEPIVALAEALREIRRDIIESADDVVWMRGGVETVVDRIDAALAKAGA